MKDQLSCPECGACTISVRPLPKLDQELACYSCGYEGTFEAILESQLTSGLMHEPRHRHAARTPPAIQVYRRGTVWRYASYVNGKLFRKGNLGIPDDAGDLEAMKAARAMAESWAGFATVGRIDVDVESSNTDDDASPRQMRGGRGQPKRLSRPSPRSH
jgi:hypothetical protein